MSQDDFHFGAHVLCADGKYVGDLRRVIVDEESLDVHAIVVKETRRFSGHFVAGTGLLEDDIAIPVTAVQSATHDEIRLLLTSDETRRTAPYLSYQYTPLTGWDLAVVAASLAIGPRHRSNISESAAKTPTELEIRPGENIMLGHSGEKLGIVRDVVMDQGELVGVVMHPTGFFKEDVLLQVRFLERSDDMALFAQLTEADLAHLQPFHPDAQEQ